VVVEGDTQQPRSGSRNSAGFRYLTVQVFDVEAEYSRVLGLGFREGMPPTKLGDIAYISFVLDGDGDGNWQPR
jgi:hypothetical protein